MPTSIQSFVLYLRNVNNVLPSLLLIQIILLIKFIILLKYLYFLAKVDLLSVNTLMRFFVASILFLQVITPAAGYYSLILLYPFFCYLIREKCIGVAEERLIILSVLPYPLSIKDLYSCCGGPLHITSGVERLFNLGLQSVVVPIVLILLFFKITEIESHE